MQEIIRFVENHTILSLTWSVLFFSYIFNICRNYFSKVININNYEAIKLINKENAVIVDLRSSNEYCSGHIINSINMTSMDIKSGNLGELEKIKHKPIIIVCNSNIGSRNPAQHLIKANFDKVYILKDGISGWNEENLPLIKKR